MPLSDKTKASGDDCSSLHSLFLLACDRKIENTPAICFEGSAIAVNENKRMTVYFTTAVVRMIDLKSQQTELTAAVALGYADFKTQT